MPRQFPIKNNDKENEAAYRTLRKDSPQVRTIPLAKADQVPGVFFREFNMECQQHAATLDPKQLALFTQRKAAYHAGRESFVKNEMSESRYATLIDNFDSAFTACEFPDPEKYSHQAASINTSSIRH